MSFEPLIIFWFRNDLRLSDNPMLFKATQEGKVMPIYIMDDQRAVEFKRGGASKVWLHHSLKSLNTSLRENLNVYAGESKDILLKLISEFQVKGIYWNRCYEPCSIKRDTDLKIFIKDLGIDCKTENASLLWEPWEVVKKDGSPYKVYTPFSKGCLQAGSPRSLYSLPLNPQWVKDPHHSLKIEDLGLLPQKEWHRSMMSYWQVGEEAASQKLQDFLVSGLQGYSEKRNFPAEPNVSRLSPYLHFGEISPHQIWHEVYRCHVNPWGNPDTDRFLKELIWREFAFSLLFHFPKSPRENFQEKFNSFPWEKNEGWLEAWKKGQTGYPIVDAGMRELWRTGYMHNRVRMIVGSFLVKNLMIHWHDGEDWFWDCLVDADLANNTMGWQWIAGCGVDANPYFRIFNPITQGEKFDPHGIYTRRFLPELSKVPNEFLFKPFKASASDLKKWGVALGETYPKPLVDLETSRNEALKALKSLA